MHTTHRSLRLRLLALVAAAAPLAALGCSSETTPTTLPTPDAALSATASDAAAAVETIIEFADGSFVPDQVDAPEGSRVMVHNTSSESITFVVQGREEGASSGEVTVPAGESVDLGLSQPGAYILTLTDDPLISAGVFIS